MSIARRFHNTRRESFEDLAQVARLGFLGAIERFDPTRGRPFRAFARITIEGQLKRHLRDHTWAIRVPRPLQEHYLAMARAVDDLTAELGRSPCIAEVADRAGLTDEAVLEAMELAATHRPASLDQADGDGYGYRPEPAATDGSYTAIEDRALLASLLRRLPEREARVLRLRFVDGLTQHQIAARIGTSQMCVSRLLARTLSKLARVTTLERCGGLR